LPESSSRMAELSATTTFKRKALCTLFSAFEVEGRDRICNAPFS